MKFICLTNCDRLSSIIDSPVVVFEKSQKYFCNPKYNFNHAQNAHARKQSEVSAYKIGDLMN